MIIGLHGNYQSGKDTTADYLVREYGFVKVGFADKLKEAVANLFDVDTATVETWKTTKIEVSIDELDADEQFHRTHRQYTWRGFLQRFGTEMGRQTFGRDFWVDRLTDTLDPELNYAIKDVRFPNEALAITSRDHGYVWRIKRDGYFGDAHESEQELDNNMIDLTLFNHGNIDELYAQVDHFMEDRYGFTTH